jgi:integrase/recombinase XerC
MPRYLTEPEFALLMRAISERQGHRNRARDRAIFLTLGRTGLRAGELVTLTMEDVKLDSSPPFLWVSTLKRRRRQRDTVLIERSLREELRGWMYVGRHAFLASIVQSVPAWGPLFPSSDPGGAAMTTRNLSALFRFYADRAKLPREITLHGLRHFRAMTLYQKTGDLEFTRRELRHRSISSTGVYLHTTPERAREYLARLEKK